MSNISSSSDFIPLSFELSLGLHTFICGYFGALVAYYFYKRGDLFLLKILNSIFFIATIFLLFQVYIDLSTAYEKGWCYNDYILKVSGLRSEFSTLFGGYMFNALGLLIIIPKILRSLQASLILATISIVLPFALLIINANDNTVYVITNIVINFLIDALLMMSIALILYFCVKNLQKLKLLSRHS